MIFVGPQSIITRTMISKLKNMCAWFVVEGTKDENNTRFTAE